MMLLTPPSFIILEPKHKKFRAIIAADIHDKKDVIEKYEDYSYLKHFGDVSKFYSFRKSVSSYLSQRLNDKILENLQLLALSRETSPSLEIEWRKTTIYEIKDKSTTPFYKTGYLESLTIISNPKIPRVVEKVHYDYDLKAKDAVTYLYEKGKDVYDIETLLSTASLGVLRNRKIVPTRWSITATDDMIAKYLYEKIRFYEKGNEVKLFIHESYHNLFYILAIPWQWSYELVEKMSNSSKIMRDYEFLKPRKDYATNTTGGYYAIRLPLLEYCEKIKEQYTFVVFREISPKYYKSVGVWILREAVRDALASKPIIFEHLNDAIHYVDTRSHHNFSYALFSSPLLNMAKKQKTLF